MIAHIVVVGGGITGLAAVERLTRNDSPAHASARVTLLEASDRFGGHVNTERAGNFVLEVGPDVLLSTKPAAVDLARRVGLGDRLQGTNPAVTGAYVLGDRGLVRLPEGLTGLVPSRLWPFATTKLLSPFGKLRVGVEWFIPARVSDDDESAETFLVRRFGREMYDRLAEPLLSGISAADGSRLSMATMFPQLRALEREHGGLLRGMLAARAAGGARPTGEVPPSERPPSEGSGDRPRNATRLTTFVSFPGGLSELVDGVARAVRGRDPSGDCVSLRTGASVQRITRDGREEPFTIALSNGETIEADAVILATPAYVAATLVETLDAELAARLGDIEYAPVITVTVAHPRSMVPRALDGTGYVVPRIRRRPVFACTWSSAKFTGRAPDDQVLVRLFLGGAGRGAWATASDDDVREIVRRELRDVLGIEGAPTLERIHRLERSMPQYAVGHPGRVAAIEGRAGVVGSLYLAGAAYGGVGIPDCIRSAERAAVAALTDVSGRGASNMITQS